MSKYSLVYFSSVDLSLNAVPELKSDAGVAFVRRKHRLGLEHLQATSVPQRFRF
jgi:hypothetical protein